MRIHERGRDFYKLEIATTPTVAASAWEASFDAGTTWHAADVVDGYSAWLVAGEKAELGDAVAVITADMVPLVRAIDNPAIVVLEEPPRIIVVC